MKKCKKNKILGLIAIFINILLALRPLSLLYAYNFTDILFLFMYPSWLLLINTLLGIIGIFISTLLFKNIIGIKLFLIVTITIWLVILSNYFSSIFL